MALVGVELSPEMRQTDLEYVNVRDFMAHLMTLLVALKSRHAMTCSYMLWNLAVQRILRGCSPGLYEIQLDGVKGLAYFDPHPGNYELLGMWRERGASGETWDRKIIKRFEKNILRAFRIIYTYTMISGKINETLQLFATEPFRRDFSSQVGRCVSLCPDSALGCFHGRWVD